MPGKCGPQIHFSHLVSAGRRYQGTKGIKLIFIILYWQAADTRELWFSRTFTSSRIGRPPIPGNYGLKIHYPHLVLAACQYQGTMVIKFIPIMSYRWAADARELCSSISFASSHIMGPPMPENYCHQFELADLVSAARRYQWKSETLCWSLTFDRRIACRCRRIRSSLACFDVLYQRIDPSYRRAVSEPPFTPPYRHCPLREHSTAPLRARRDSNVPALIFRALSIPQCRSEIH